MKLRGITNGELTEEYGDQMRFEIGECFKCVNLGGTHYYCQMNGFVLHLNNYPGIINRLHNSSLDEKELVKIKKSEFDDIIKTIIFELEIYKWADR